MNNVDKYLKYRRNFYNFMKDFCFIEEDGFSVFSLEKMIGYSVIIKIREYVKTHPEISIIDYLDDSMATNGVLVLIPNYDEIIFQYIPQQSTAAMFYLSVTKISELNNAIKNTKKIFG